MVTVLVVHYLGHKVACLCCDHLNNGFLVHYSDPIPIVDHSAIGLLQPFEYQTCPGTEWSLYKERTSRTMVTKNWTNNSRTLMIPQQCSSILSTHHWRYFRRKTNNIQEKLACHHNLTISISFFLCINKCSVIC